jgi:phage antirepressor YoqD-like protein
VNINAIAKDYGMSGVKLNALLHGLGVQYSQDKQWLLYAKHQDMGYTHSQTIEYQHKDGTPDVRLHTQWTQKGRLFLYELLKETGVLPMIERNGEVVA